MAAWKETLVNAVKQQGAGIVALVVVAVLAYQFATTQVPKHLAMIQAGYDKNAASIEKIEAQHTLQIQTLIVGHGNQVKYLEDSHREAQRHAAEAFDRVVTRMEGRIDTLEMRLERLMEK